MSTQHERLLQERYARTGDRRARRELIELNLGLAHRLARRYSKSTDSADDLRQVAAVGLIKAVDRFEPGYGSSFTSFAIPTIIGEIKRYFRDTRWALHVPRFLQERAQAVERHAEALTQELRRSPTLAEVAERLGLSVEEVIEARAAFTAIDAVSLDSPLPTEGDTETAGDLVGVEDDGYRLVEDRDAVAPALSRLPECDRLALKMTFVDEMTQSEIGARLNVSQMQVSRMIRRSLADMRQAIDAPVAA